MENPTAPASTESKLPFNIEINPTHFIVGLSLAVIAVKATPSLVQLVKNLGQKVSVLKWRNLNTQQVGILGFLLIAQVVPMFPVALGFYINHLAKTTNPQPQSQSQQQTQTQTEPQPQK